VRVAVGWASLRGELGLYVLRDPFDEAPRAQARESFRVLVCVVLMVVVMM
jgi:hypothetical protein